ncbi:hypothetical protein D6764_01155, partial [Candidatus Woesearchaeota archaeon]
KRVPLTSGRTQYLVRELYRGKLTGHEIKHGFLKKGESVKLISEMKDGILIADGVGTEHRVPEGSVVKIMPADNPLRVYL